MSYCIFFLLSFLFIFFFISIVHEIVSLYSPKWSETYCVEKAGFGTVAILLPLPSEFMAAGNHYAQIKILIYFAVVLFVSCKVIRTEPECGLCKCPVPVL